MAAQAEVEKAIKYKEDEERAAQAKRDEEGPQS